MRARTGERLIVTGLTLLAAASVCGIAGKLWTRNQERQRIQSLQSRVDAPVQIVRIELADTANLAVSAVAARPAAAQAEAAGNAAAETLSQEAVERCESLQALAEENGDFVGWISLAGTKINYPVMQSVDRPWYYLDRDFEKKRSKSGMPFIEERCDLKGNRANLIIYGHNMKDGSMFAALHQLADRDFYEANRELSFDTPDRTGRYRIVSVFYMSLEEEATFQFYRYPNLPDAAHFEEYAQQVRQHALFPVDTELAFGDELLTLVTCVRGKKPSRLVVVAKRL